YPLTIWPYHSMLGGIGHALVSAVEEAIFFHTIARNSQALFEIKGGNPLTENYSVLRPEVLDGFDGNPIAEKNAKFIDKLLDFDEIIIAGQAKSHCVAWTIDDLLTEILTRDPNLAKKVYLLEDCTSPVVVPGVVDFT
ncbi:isochorismatase, partial [Microcoleus sp. HI-ES]|nr:isochorismatase [Microcoleus sp. HI-ES]